MKSTLPRRFLANESGWCLRANRLGEGGSSRTYFAAISRMGDGVFWYVLMAALILVDGFDAWTLTADGSTWVFFCNSRRARCEYLMWLVTPGALQPNNDTPGTTHNETPASVTPIPVAASTSLG